ncbi:TetR/AcrR family transcriptional regulator [Craterilacuibacter sp. RT1T]|uniref:TetR/AcrR family transcriptional regulator n=1 Tax=Craterilacuibacter sp. RT1T TaxID=2942211 RepID=UPI0020C03F82|nr:TetR/AcrR family transcriptional regulator [Craterilacuibacter sp. RT1T]MCL6262938.1 TetR/AcrR family transcriptional regulator [Craterilacuibacter sp. RT1T]
MSKTRIKTYDKIVAESLKLFNEHGERAITTNHISAHLGISPGNLYYHFRNKEEIVFQIFREYEAFIRAQLTPKAEDAITPQALSGQLDSLFKGMWNYRFLFDDLPGLLSRNPQLQAEYHATIGTDLRPMMGDMLKGFARAGLLTFSSDEEVEQLAVNIWLVVKFWYAFEQSAAPKVPISVETGRRGARQVLALMRPYVTADNKAAFTELDASYR